MESLSKPTRHLAIPLAWEEGQYHYIDLENLPPYFEVGINLSREEAKGSLWLAIADEYLLQNRSEDCIGIIKMCLRDNLRKASEDETVQSCRSLLSNFKEADEFVEKYNEMTDSEEEKEEDETYEEDEKDDEQEADGQALSD